MRNDKVLCQTRTSVHRPRAEGHIEREGVPGRGAETHQVPGHEQGLPQGDVGGQEDTGAGGRCLRRDLRPALLQGEHQQDGRESARSGQPVAGARPR